MCNIRMYFFDWDFFYKIAEDFQIAVTSSRIIRLESSDMRWKALRLKRSFPGSFWKFWMPEMLEHLSITQYTHQKRMQLPILLEMK